MRYFLHIAGFILLLVCVQAFAGYVKAQDESFIIWAQQERENTTQNGAIAYSRDGRFVASGRSDSNDVNIRNANDGTLIRTLNGQNNNANVLAFSPDSQYLV